MKIAYLSSTFPPYPGGIGINAYYNAREMARRGHETEVLTPRYKTNHESPQQSKFATGQAGIRNQGFVVHYLRPWFSYGNAALLPQLLWRLRKFDIVHLYYPFFGGAEMAALARKIFKFKLAIHYEMDVAGESWLKKFFSFHTRHILPWILKNCDMLFVLSEDYFKNSDIGRLYGKNRNLPPWKVVPNGVDTEHFAPQNNLKSPVILFVAGLDKAHYFKGVPILLEAVKILKEEKFFVKLLIAGEGELKKDYQKKTHDLDVGDLVEFLGLITHDNLPDFYSSGSLFVMPSVGSTESFSIATAEAQACGLPAIVSDLPGMRVTIQNGVTGFLAKPGDAADLAQKIRIVLSDPQLVQKMGEAGRERMERYFSWKVIGDRLVDIYRYLLIFVVFVFS